MANYTLTASRNSVTVYRDGIIAGSARLDSDGAPYAIGVCPVLSRSNAARLKVLSLLTDRSAIVEAYVRGEREAAKELGIEFSEEGFPRWAIVAR